MKAQSEIKELFFSTHRAKSIEGCLRETKSLSTAVINAIYLINCMSNKYYTGSLENTEEQASNK
ncbi:MAG: hypothetical protein ABGY95_04970, partial [Rubritalea sp.]|uniref:hypothetical protein n=1 Tax=Rubritalea sp. TaxID=2109375 RepID=UPI003242EB00